MKLRWVLAGMIVAGTIVNYIDRQTVSVLAPVLVRDLHLNNLAYAKIGTAFLLTYALTMWLWGRVCDRVGNRTGYAVAAGFWSVVEVAHAFARSALALTGLRGALGAGESGNWPAATRTVAEWFEPGERALAMGIANTGAAIGSAIAPPMIVAMNAGWGWRGVFVVTGVLGMLWTVVWLAVYPRNRVPAVAGDSAAEPRPRARPETGRSLLVRGVEGQDPGSTPRGLLKHRAVWGIILGRAFGDPIWWLYLIWLPKYLHDARGFSMAQIGYAAWVPFAAAGVGCLAGGWLSGALLRTGWTVNKARKTAIVVATVLMPAGVLAAFAPSAAGALAWMSVSTFGFQFWVGNVQTLPSDYFPVSAVGSIAGYSGTAAGLGAAAFTFSTGAIVDRWGYTPVLVIAAVLAPVATALLFAVSGPIRKVA